MIPGDVFRRLQPAFPPLVAGEEDGHSVLSWPEGASQKDLLRCLEMLDAEGLEIENVGRRAATLEEVFVRLTSEETA